MAAGAQIWPLAWKLPYATGAALKRKKKKTAKKHKLLEAKHYATKQPMDHWKKGNQKILKRQMSMKIQ